MAIPYDFEIQDVTVPAFKYEPRSWKTQADGTPLEDLRRCMRSFVMAYTDQDFGRNAFFDALLARSDGHAEGTPEKPAPEPFRLQFRQDRAERNPDARTGRLSQYMEQESFLFPPPTLKESMLYRIEHSTYPSASDKRLGSGPYGNGSLDDVPYTKIVDGQDTTPAPSGDPKLLQGLREHLGINYVRGEHHFGFESVEKMKRWFDSPRFWESMPRAGYVVRRYWGTAIHGGCQSVLDTRLPFRRVDTLTVL